MIVKRVVALSGSGKGRAYLNGALAPVSLLDEVGGWLADVHGQHEQQSLLRVATHLEEERSHPQKALPVGELIAEPSESLTPIRTPSARPFSLAGIDYHSSSIRSPHLRPHSSGSKMARHAAGVNVNSPK